LVTLLLDHQAAVRDQIQSLVLRATPPPPCEICACTTSTLAVKVPLRPVFIPLPGPGRRAKGVPAGRSEPGVGPQDQSSI
jgi:hypothetical protein